MQLVQAYSIRREDSHDRGLNPARVKAKGLYQIRFPFSSITAEVARALSQVQFTTCVVDSNW